LGAHVSTQGGIEHAPARGAAIGATVIQIFTRSPNRWRARPLAARTVAAFRRALRTASIRLAIAHDSYLINLASPDPALRRRSIRAFTGELQRCRALGVRWVVSHPGNYIDDPGRGLHRNARGYAACLARVPGPVGVLIEGTAGAGTTLGGTFEALRDLREALPAPLRPRVGFCLDTAHLHAAGYDIASGDDTVWRTFDRVVGLRLLRCLHLNDSKAARGSRLDRHELIGEGAIGPAAFRRIMRDPRFRSVAKIIETPKGDDPPSADRRMIERLRGYAGGGRTIASSRTAPGTRRGTGPARIRV
jgi:deoxyribonuclease-4